MGAYKNDQVVTLNIKPQDKINFLIKEVEKLKIEILKLKEIINSYEHKH